jgi:hypothetical protein
MSNSLGGGGSGSGSSGGGSSSGGGASSGGASGSSSGSSGGSVPNLPKNWACLQQPVPAPPSSSVQVEFLFSDGQSAAPIAGVKVQACASLDPACAKPIQTATGNDAGIASLTVPGGFNGIYEAQASTFVPAILSRPPQLSSEYVTQSLVTAASLSAAASVAGVTQDPTLGVAFVSANDCSDAPAGGIVFDVGTAAHAQVVYLLNSLPSSTATQTDAVSGTALVFNLPPGSLKFTASLATNGTAILTTSAIVRENWVTYVTIRPDQASHPSIP